jgi:hypothetical protein
MKVLPWSVLAMCIDCEGCITIGFNRWKGTPNSNGIYNMEISVINTDRRLMDWLVSNFGGRYTSSEHKDHPEWKIRYQWRVTGRNNREKVLLGIIPYLILKREQAKLALEFIRIPKYERNVEQRKELMLACKQLNTKGRPAPTTNTLDCSFSEQKIESELTGDRESAPGVIQGGDKIPGDELAA